jgi:3-deoxy-D-manno-octulosonate 8-phosphate phosphatase (KDO 8-P phosphatase)
LIELLVLDVDGCMTDGGIIYSNAGEESKVFNVKDGLAIATWIKLGKKVAIITGRSSKVVEIRAKELGVNFLFQGVKNKKEKLDQILKSENLTYENVAAIGDDLNDVKLLKSVALSFAPKDSNHFAKDIVDIVLDEKGGKGAIREMIEYIIFNGNMTEDFIKQWQ